MIQESPNAETRPSPSGPAPSGQEPQAIAGQWPVEAPKTGLLLTGMLWALWVLFLVWMVFVRLDTTPVGPTSGGG